MSDEPTTSFGGWPDGPDPSSDRFVLRLYVTGTTPRSSRAIENVKQICEEHLSGRYDLEVVDIYANPESARLAQVIAAPTLVKLSPEPLRRIIGDLTDRAKVLSGLGISTGMIGDRPDGAP